MEPGGVALVTGAGRGIGRAVAVELAQRGFEVVGGVRDPESAARLVAAAPERIRLAQLDVRQPGAWQPPAGLRVLVNNAGVDADHGPVETSPLEAWHRLFETNVFGLVEVTRRAIPALRASGGGVLCNLSSASLLFPMPFYAAYRASKAAVAALGDSLRAELAPFGIRVLEVLPGPVQTDMLAASPSSVAMPEAYRELAARAERGRAQAASAAVSAEQAAQAIVDAILDDAAPQRVTCDPVGAGLLEAWRASPDDESWARSMLTSLLDGD